MLNVELLSDRLARASLEKRRQKETERKEKIFNDKLRTIGVDKEALNMQVKEKREQEAAAKKEQIAYDADMCRNSKVARILHNRQMKEKRALEKDIVTYRRQHQQPGERQGYDLSDSDRAKITEQSDAQMMPPGLVGEDPESKSRLQRQREQLREWLIQQQTAQAAERHQQKLEEQQYYQSIVEMDSRAVQLQSLEMERRKAAAIATKHFNLAMAEEKRRREEECIDKQNNFQGTEWTPSMVAVPGLSPSSDRKVPPESLQQIVQFQKYQIEEKRRNELEQKQEEEWHDRMRLNSTRTALLIERQQARLNRQLRRDLDNANAQLAEAHKQKPELKRGSIDDSFFSKFNTCSR